RSSEKFGVLLPKHLILPVRSPRLFKIKGQEIEPGVLVGQNGAPIVLFSALDFEKVFSAVMLLKIMLEPDLDSVVRHEVAGADPVLVVGKLRDNLAQRRTLWQFDELGQ